MLGLSGEEPDQVDPAAARPLADAVRATGILPLPGTAGLAFAVDDDIILHRRQRLPFHPNAMRFTALGADGAAVSTRTYYSIGGGFVLGEDAAGQPAVVADTTAVPYPFTTGAELLGHCAATGLPISSVMLANELTRRDADEIRDGLLHIWARHAGLRGARRRGRRRAARRPEGAAPGARGCASTLEPSRGPRPTRCTRWSGSPPARWR